MSLALSSSKAFTACRAGARPATRRTFCVSVKAQAGQVNPDIKKDVEKVVDMLKAEDMPKKAVLCRCWRSATFPYCNGAHVKHNQATGDNVGPLIIEKSS